MINSIDLLKSLNAKVATKTKKGVSKFPRRAGDFVLKSEKKYPLYPFENFIGTVEFFAKAENLEKFDDPITLVKSIYDYRDIYYSDLMEKSEVKEIGLFFNISGKKIQEAVEKKVGKLKAELKEHEKIAPAQSQSEGFIDTSMPYLDELAQPKQEDWKTRSLKKDIEKYAAIARNLEENKTYKLCEYDLERYGL